MPETTTQGCAGAAARKSIFAMMAEIDVNALPYTLSLKPVKPTDKIVGLLSDDLRRLLVVAHNLDKEAVEMRLLAMRNASGMKRAHAMLHLGGMPHGHVICKVYGEDMQRLEKEVETAFGTSQAALDAFWAHVRVEYPEIGDGTPGVRKDFFLVLNGDEPSGSRPDELKGLGLADLMRGLMSGELSMVGAEGLPVFDIPSFELGENGGFILREKPAGMA